MNYLLIGGSGFIGTQLTHKLLQQEDTVYNVDPTPQPFNETQNYHYQPHLITEEFIEKSDKIIYLASNSHVRSSQTQVDIELGNLTSFINFLEQIKNHTDKTVMLMSSGGHVYGENPQTPIREENCLRPVSPYGITKATMEYYLRYYANKYGFNYITTRLGNVYGPGQNPESGAGLITRLLFDYHKGNKTPIVSNPSGSIRDYIYISDVISAIIQLLTTPYTINNTYNISTKRGYSIKHIIGKIREVCGYRLSLDEKGMGVEDVSRIILDNTKLTTYTGWQPIISLEDGIKFTNDYVMRIIEEEGIV